MLFELMFPIPPVVYGDTMAPVPSYFPDPKALPDLSYHKGSYQCEVCRKLTGWQVFHANMFSYVCSTECLSALAESEAQLKAEELQGASIDASAVVEVPK